MRLGDLNHLLTIETNDRATGANGERVDRWREVAEVWASLKPRSAYRREQAAQTIGTVTHDVSMHYTPDLTPDCRLRAGSRVFNLVGPPINVDERDREWRVSVVEVTGG